MAAGDSEGQEHGCVRAGREALRQGGGYETVGPEYEGPARGTASSWDLLLQKVAGLGLSADCLQEARQQFDRDGSVKIDLEAA
jgi:hypothetical protein